MAPLIEFTAVALGLLLALALLSAKRGNATANRWLAAYVAVLALLSFGDLCRDARWVLEWPTLAHVADWLIFMVGPLLWMYVRRLTQHETPTFRRWLLHTIPSLLTLLLLLPFFFSPLAIKQADIAAELAQNGRRFDYVLFVAVLQTLAYWVASLVALQRFRGELEDRYSDTGGRRFDWLRIMLMINLGLWLVWIAGIYTRSPWVDWVDLVSVPLGLYAIALLGLRQPAVFAGTQEFVPRAEQPRYQRSGLDPARVAALRARLEELLGTEKPWLENDLTLAQLAARIDTSPHHLSQLLNEHMGVSFFELVNGHRVREVQRCLRDPAYAGQSILDVALAAGFSSKASFNAVFKEQSGMTPSEYRRGAD
jgi:AraC-like DNA-binding protein